MIKLIVIVMKQFTRRTLRKRVINVPILLEQLLNLTLTESENILQVKCFLVSFVTTNQRRRNMLKHIKSSIAGKKAEREEH